MAAVLVIGLCFLLTGCKQRQLLVYEHENHTSVGISDRKKVAAFDQFCDSLEEPLEDKYSNVFWNRIESGNNTLYFSYDELRSQNRGSTAIIECNGLFYEFSLDSETGKTLLKLLEDLMP